MSLFQPTAMYFGQPVAASGGGGYIIRPDTYASSVTLAIPGTVFGSTFGQTSFRSDISGYINGGSSLADSPTSGSGKFFPSGSNNFSGTYSTSMGRQLGNLGAYAGNTSNFNFGTGSFTVEFWWNPSNQTGESAGLFAYGSQCGFMQMSYAAGYYRWVGSTSSGEFSSPDYVVTPAANTWYHIAMCRSGSTWYGCFNGFIRRVATLGGTVNTASPFGLMGWNGNAGQVMAAFQDFRVTKGVARYTGALNAAYTIPESIVTIS